MSDVAREVHDRTDFSDATIEVGGLTLTPSAPAGLATDAIVELLGQVAFLRSVPPDSLRELVATVPLRQCEAGDVIIRQGEFGHSVFVLLDGALVVEIGVGGAPPREVTRISAPGSTFGEGAVVGRRRRSATVRTLGPSVLLEISKTRIERLDKSTDGTVLPALAVLAELRELATFVEQHRFLSRLSVEGRQIIKAFARLETYARGVEVFGIGDPAERVYVVKSGAAELLTTTADGSESVVNYLTVGDAVGVISDSVHRYRLVSRGHLQLLELDHRRLRELSEPDLEIWSRFRKDSQFVQLDASRALAAVDPRPAAADLTVNLYIKGMIDDGAQEGLSVLTIDLDTCIRCGNCVRACQARHGHARFTRRGEKLVRRSEIGDDKRHQTVLLPSSCRHCVDPVCMIDCPTGAIHRTAAGEVVIEDTCIGCSSCANRCPWGNITMVEAPRLVDGIPRDRLANKCDLCAGYDEPNCVHNCPTGAILRVEPASYFPELRAVLRRTQPEALPRTEWHREVIEGRSRRARALNAALFIGGVGGAAALHAFAGAPYSPWSAQGLTLGALALICLLGAGSLALRRRRAADPRRVRPKGRWSLPAQGGSFLAWTRLHGVLGALFLTFALFHSGGRLGGAATAALLIVAFAEAAIGLFGVLFGRWMPRVITRLEGGSQVEEDVLGEIERRRARLAEQLAKLDAIPARAFAWARDFAGGRRRRLSEHLGFGFGGRTRARPGGSSSRRRRRRPRDAAERLAHVKAEMRNRGFGLTPGERCSVDDAVENHLRLVDLGVCRWLYRMRRAWLGLHIVLAVLIGALTLVHVTAVLVFVVRGTV